MTQVHDPSPQLFEKIWITARYSTSASGGAVPRVIMSASQHLHRRGLRVAEKIGSTCFMMSALTSRKLRLFSMG
jgi:hypothetical protein